MSTRSISTAVLISCVLAGAAACSGNRPAPATTPSTPVPSTPATTGGGTPVPQPGQPVVDTTGRTTEPATVPIPAAPVVTSDPLTAMPLDDLNRSTALQPVFFVVDSDELDPAARQALVENAQVLKKYPGWIVTVEGHCDERGSAEYNMALGERRALAARNYLVSLGVNADRVRTVSYGKEFPFDPGHGEDAWAMNRRAQFMVTARAPSEAR